MSEAAAPVRAFLALAAPLGLALALALPPLAAPDEARHLGRLWTLLDGAVLPPPATGPEAARVPRSFATLDLAVNGPGVPAQVTRRSVQDAWALTRLPLEPERSTRLPNVVSYPPVAYLPALLGVAAGRAAGAGPGALVLLGRLANLAAWLALTAWAIALCPRARWLLVALATLPTSLAMAAAVSTDPLTNAAGLLLLALVARAALAPRAAPPARGELAGLGAAALLLGLAKPGYAPLALAALAIPRGRGAQRMALAAALLTVAAVPGALWLAVASAHAPPAPLAGADPAAQLRWLAAQPLAFAAVLARSLAGFGGAWLQSLIGVIGPLTVVLPGPAYAAVALALPAAWLADADPAAPAWPGRRRAWLAAAFLACALATLAMTYLAANPPGAARVRGFQGRYLLPAVPALALALPLLRRAPPAFAREALLALAAAAGLGAVAAVVARYYALWATSSPT